VNPLPANGTILAIYALPHANRAVFYSLVQVHLAQTNSIVSCPAAIIQLYS
jgi:hypothetical protein